VVINNALGVLPWATEQLGGRSTVNPIVSRLGQTVDLPRNQEGSQLVGLPIGSCIVTSSASYCCNIVSSLTTLGAVAVLQKQAAWAPTSQVHAKALARCLNHRLACGRQTFVPATFATSAMPMIGFLTSITVFHLVAFPFLRSSLAMNLLTSIATCSFLVPVAAFAVAATMDMFQCSCSKSSLASPMHVGVAFAFYGAWCLPFVPLLVAWVLSPPGNPAQCPSLFANPGDSPPPDLVWPAHSTEAVLASIHTTLSMYWVMALTVMTTIVLLIVDSQSSIAMRLEQEARAAADRMYAALRYVSQEARSPLNGAMLSLSLLDETLSENSLLLSPSELVGDLHASLETAKRKLDDVLTLETVAHRSVSSFVPWTWGKCGGLRTEKLRLAFAGACRAEHVDLVFVDSSSHPQLDSELLFPSHPCASEFEVFSHHELITTVLQTAISNSLRHGCGKESNRIVVSVSVQKPSPLHTAPRQRPTVLGGGWVRAGRSGEVIRMGSRLTSSRHSLGDDDRHGSATGPEVGALVIQVRDWGRGISEENLVRDRVFRPFQQVRLQNGELRTTASGLGLSIIRSIVVEQLGGQIGLVSDGESGTLFFARVPVWVRTHESFSDISSSTSTSTAVRAMDSRPAGDSYMTHPTRWEDGDDVTDPGNEAAVASAVAEACSPLLVCVVDDDRSTRVVMQRVLERWGFAVEQFAHGGAFVAFIRSLLASPSTPQWPAIVTLDGVMPVMDGKAVLQELRSILDALAEDHPLRAMQVIGLTGGTPTEASVLRELGAVDILTKPVDAGELRLALQEAHVPVPTSQFASPKAQLANRDALSSQ
jgi:signal transduction histidine kinase/CheY-like chemotaxis protein